MDAMFRQVLQMPLPEDGQVAEGAKPVPAEPQAQAETIEPTKSVPIIPQE